LQQLEFIDNLTAKDFIILPALPALDLIEKRHIIITSININTLQMTL
jgi:hypothetical protein